MATADDVDNISYQVLCDLADRIVTSGIDHSPLARKLFTQKILSHEKYEAVIDRYTGQTNRERLDMIMLEVQSAVKSDETVLDMFILILKDLGGKVGVTLAKELEVASHKDIQKIPDEKITSNQTLPPVQPIISHPTKPVSEYIKKSMKACDIELNNLYQVVNDQHLLILAKKIDRYYYILPSADIEAVKRECQRDEMRCRIKVLRRWKEQEGDDATYLELARLLESGGRKDLVDLVMQLVGNNNFAEDKVTVRAKKKGLSNDALKSLSLDSYQSVVESISKKIDYYLVGSWLGYTDEQLQAIKYNNDDEEVRRKKLLELWCQENGKEATVWKLSLALASCDRIDLLDQLLGWILHLSSS